MISNFDPFERLFFLNIVRSFAKESVPCWKREKVIDCGICKACADGNRKPFEACMGIWVVHQRDSFKEG